MRAIPFLMAGATLAFAVPAQAADPARQRIDAYHLAVIASARGGGTLPARVARFEGVMRTYYDMPIIAALVVGPAWTKATAADRSAVAAALTRHGAIQLAKNFKGFSGPATTDPAVIARGADTLVRSTLGSDPLVYRLRGGRIIDVLAGGVSQLAVQRSDFAAAVAAGGAAGLARQLAASDAKAMTGG